MPLPAPHELIHRKDLSFEEIVTTLTTAGYAPFEARRLAAFATGRTHGDVVRRPSRPATPGQKPPRAARPEPAEAR